MPPEAPIELENPDVAWRKIAALAIGFLAFVGVSLALLLAYFHFFDRGATVSAAQDFRAPRLEKRNGETLDEVRVRQGKLLESYALVDSQKHLVRVPVERAMEMIVARGPAAFDPLESSPASEGKTQ